MGEESLDGTYRDVSVEDLRPNPWNPNRLSDYEFELLCRSMEEDGFTQPIIVDENTMMIVDGEHRWRAWRALGYATIPVHLKDYDPVQMRISTLRHNRTRGSEDIVRTGKLMHVLEKEGAEDWVKDSLMVDDVEWELLTMDSWAEAPLPAGKPPRTVREVEEARAKERRVETDKMREDSAQWDSQFYQLNLVYLPEEGDVIQRVLGEKQAQSILSLCKLYEAGELEVEL